MTATRVATGWYVYGVVSAGVEPAVFAATPGVDAGPVTLVVAFVILRNHFVSGLTAGAFKGA